MKRVVQVEGGQGRSPGKRTGGWVGLDLVFSSGGPRRGSRAGCRFLKRRTSWTAPHLGQEEESGSLKAAEKGIANT